MERRLLALLPDDQVRWLELDVGAYVNDLPASHGRLGLPQVLTCACMACELRFLLAAELTFPPAARQNCRELEEHCRAVVGSEGIRWGAPTAHALTALLDAPTTDACLPACRTLVTAVLANRTGRQVQWTVNA